MQCLDCSPDVDTYRNTVVHARSRKGGLKCRTLPAQAFQALFKGRTVALNSARFVMHAGCHPLSILPMFDSVTSKLNGTFIAWAHCQYAQWRGRRNTILICSTRGHPQHESFAGTRFATYRGPPPVISPHIRKTLLFTRDEILSFEPRMLVLRRNAGRMAPGYCHQYS